ncbi:MAG: NAD-dependent epimerase/dehydratase family protein, partial [Patescibacteria group bacterium]
ANAYGPRQNPKGEAGVIAIFGSLMKKGKTPTIFGDGTKTRDYVYVDDIVRANVLALTKGNNMTINLGWGKEIQDKEIFDIIAKTTKFKKNPNLAPRRDGELSRSSLDVKKANKTIGWKPTIKLQNGIAKTIASL